MSLTDHLEELRKTLIRVLIILCASFAVCYSAGDIITEFLLRPLRHALDGREGGIVYLGLLDKILSQLQVAFWSSILLSSPLWFHQMWLFIRPGLFYHEVKVIRPFIFIGFIFFCLGALFGRYLVFPFTFQTLLNFGVSDVTATIALKDYLILASKVLVFLGLAFQLPNILLIMGFMGLVTKHNLRKKRSFVYMGFAVVAGLITPPDPYTMMGLWVPLVLLFEVGVMAVSLIVHPYLKKRQDEAT